jgi:hypothetical protein
VKQQHEGIRDPDGSGENHFERAERRGGELDPIPYR